MHVCFFNRAYWPDLSATGQLLTEMAEGLAARHGWTVTVVTGYPLRTDVRPSSREARNGVTIVRAAGTTFSPRRFAGRASNYVSYFGSAALRGLTVRRPDVVVAMTDPPIIGLAALALARRAGAPFVSWCQDIFPEVAVLLEDFQSSAVNRALSAVNRFQLSQAAAIVALGETMKHRLVTGKGADPQRIHIVDNWADCSQITPGDRVTSWAEAQGLADRFVVLHAGNLGLSQDLDNLMHAAARLRRRPDILFLFVGGGVRESALRAQAESLGLDNVRFVPHQPKDAMPPWYAASDVSLISLRRGLAGVIVPSKTYSALAAGRACIAAVEPECEVAGLVTAAACGLVVAPGDPDALARAIESLADDRPRAAAMGRRARAAALQFDLPRQVARFDAVLRSVARR
ncbi:MAG: glycosyltransferase family 4 protein [Vicinamibacterales bacterium]